MLPCLGTSILLGPFNEISDFSVDSIENACASVERIETSYSDFGAFII